MGIVLDTLSELTLTRSLSPFTQKLSESLSRPTSLSGVDVSKSVVGTLSVALQQNANQFQSEIIFSDLDLLDTFTIGVNAESKDYQPEESALESTLDSIVEFINADPDLSPIVFATFEGSSIFLSNVMDGRHTTAISSSGTTVLTFLEEANSLDVRVWGKVKGYSWVQINDGFFNVTDRGVMEILAINAIDRIYIQIENVDSQTDPAKTKAEIFFGVGERE